MRTTIDADGRIVVPNRLRDELRLEPGQALEIAAGDGRLEIEPQPTPMQLERREGGLVDVPGTPLPVLTAGDVREAHERLRR